MPTNVTKNWLLGENANAGISGVGSGTPSLGSGATFPTGMPIKVSHSYMTSDYGPNATTTEVNFWSPTYTPIQDNSIIYASLYLEIEHQKTSSIGDNRLAFTYEITGDGVTNFDRALTHWTFSEYGTVAATKHYMTTIELKPMTVTSTDAITYVLRMRNENAHADSKWTIHGNDNDESMIKFTEIAG